MNDVVISARGLGKRYLIGHETVDRNQTFRERIMAGAGGLARNLAKTARGEQLVQGEVEEFWALKDVNFDIRRGDTVGIIGRNGAGKSTLLKILSRITEPTTGRVDIRGRVASLLEVGTGFHPELTGRENIFLNGAILGMSRAEIRRKLDEIIHFAGVEKFLDTPVKRYSSGMRVRLAFSVAAHLEPEILIIDEVLAVGDAEFQSKCLGKMEDVAQQGRTVLFVSHNMAAVSRLCEQAMLLTDGRSAGVGAIDEVFAAYRGATSNILSSGARRDLRDHNDRYGSGDTKFSSIVLLDSRGIASSEICFGESISLLIEFSGPVPRDAVISALCLSPEDHRVLQIVSDDDPTFSIGSIDRHAIRVHVANLPLQPGQFNLLIGLHDQSMQPLDVVRNAYSFRVVEHPEKQRRRHAATAKNGYCTTTSVWTVEIEKCAFSG
ncbi:ABC transporter ATP-binding protein [Roseitranquillus sediminis]|uniref:ABC transporter ATP-binding protein n=1 Tax=Roseitranquillus sediminis TaxID=2809051 RepID=UPI001D0C32CF|nr:ABC transporter ATP-binding protein [Roseitranquillus sediminis]MBM9594004.1 ABC transporter ATP-binding protein [Roseitranquillus sediminis]